MALKFPNSVGKPGFKEQSVEGTIRNGWTTLWVVDDRDKIEPQKKLEKRP